MRTNIRTGIGRDDGWAIPIVAMIIAFVTVLSVGGFALSSQSLRESVVVEDESRAFQAANAGLDAAIAHLPGGQMSYTFGPADLGSDTTATVTVTKPTAFTYIVTSTGTAKRTSNGQISSEQVVAEFTRFDLYGMNISAGTENPPADMFGAGTVKGNSDVYGPYYTGTGIASGHFSYGPVFVAGNVTGGTFSDIVNAYVGGSAGGLTATTMSSSVPKMPPLPAVDAVKLQGWLDTAKAQSIDNKMGDTSTALNEGTLNTAGTYPRTLYSNWNKTTTYPYYKYYGPAAGSFASGGGLTVGGGTTHLVIDKNTASFGNGPEGGGTFDDFAWNKDKKLLFVNGTVFIDGDFTIDMKNDTVLYYGNGTIVSNGKVHIIAKVFQPFAGLSTAIVDGKSWDHQTFPENQVVGFVSPTEIHLTGSSGNSDKARGDDPDIAGAFYCPLQIQFENNLLVAGSIITNKMVGPNSGNNVHLRNSPNLAQVAPQGLPGRNDGLMGFTRWIRK
jgi:Tfp pilus assembly protein PilX